MPFGDFPTESKENGMAKINVEPEIMKFQISCLAPWEENPREISPEALKGLRDSLEKFGYVDLIVVNKRNMQVISGHQRLRVLKEDGAVDTESINVNELHRLPGPTEHCRLSYKEKWVFNLFGLDWNRTKTLVSIEML